MVGDFVILFTPYIIKILAIAFQLLSSAAVLWSCIKFQYKGEPYWFSGWQGHLQQTEKRTPCYFYKRIKDINPLVQK